MTRLAAAIATTLALAAPARAQDVDTVLLLAVDVSQSMDPEEQAVQRDGYVAAIASPDFAAAVTAGVRGRIAISVMEFAGAGEQWVVVPWRVIDGEPAALELADDLAMAPIHSSHRTSITSALERGVELIRSSGYGADRSVIDVSGDGPNNQGGPVEQARDSAVNAGVVINGLPIMTKAGAAWATIPNLDAYYEDCVIGGPLSFIVRVDASTSFSSAIRRKLVSEIAGREPEQTTATPVAGREPVNCRMYD